MLPFLHVKLRLSSLLICEAGVSRESGRKSTWLVENRAESCPGEELRQGKTPRRQQVPSARTLIKVFYF